MAIRFTAASGSDFYRMPAKGRQRAVLSAINDNAAAPHALCRTGALSPSPGTPSPSPAPFSPLLAQQAGKAAKKANASGA